MAISCAGCWTDSITVQRIKEGRSKMMMMMMTMIEPVHHSSLSAWYYYEGTIIKGWP